MKLLCVVNRYLQKFLTEGLRGSELIFCAQWDEAARELTSSKFDLALVYGELVEDDVQPLQIWSAASQLRLLGVKTIFIGLSYDGTRIINEFYAGMSYISYPANASEFFLELQTSCPEIFTESRFSTSDSSFAGRRKFNRSILPDVSDSSALGLRREALSISQMSQAPRQSVEAIAAVSSMPLGLRRAGTSSAKNITTDSSGGPRIRASEAELNSDLQMIMGDISSSGTISGISSISGMTSSEASAIERALLASSSETNCIADPINPQPQPEFGHRNIQVSESAIRQKPFDPLYDTQSSVHNADEVGTVVVKRSANDIQFGSIEFGTIMRVIVQIQRLGLTGILEVKNETRTIHIEYKEGKAASSSQLSFLESACLWETGSFTFNPVGMLSRDCTPLDVEDLVTRVVNDQLSLNQILRTLGYEMRHYLLVTDCFDEEQHTHASFQWWKECLGAKRLNDIMGIGNMSMDLLARDIYRAWLCDEVTFTDVVSMEPAQVIYANTPRVTLHDHREKSRITLDASNDSHLNTIRTELIKIRDSFENSDGYAILGLKQGCGTKALDDAYYAWINRYHTDRYVRYKDPEIVQLANDLVMMMNNIYPRLSKSERIGMTLQNRSVATMPSVSAFESGLGNPRIGSTRHRISTLSTNEVALNNNNDKLNQVSRELQAIGSNENDRVYSSNQRVFIRPSSNSTMSSVPNRMATPQSENLRTVQAQKMSDYLAEKRASSSSLNPRSSSQSNLIGRRPSDSNLRGVRGRGSGIGNAVQGEKDAGGMIRPVQTQTTPLQYFQTGRKKLLLDLIPDAVNAFQLACEGEPDNKEYQINLVYANALNEAEKRADAVLKLREFLPDAQKKYTDSRDQAAINFIFSIYYFCGKIELILEEFEKAADDFMMANKINPADIDTQRCMRFVQTQIEKIAESAKPKSSIFTKLKDQINKGF